MRYIFIDEREDEEFSGLMEDNRLVEFYVDSSSHSRSLGNIYRGRVRDVLKGIDAAFVDIGMDENAYLPKSAARPLDRQDLDGGETIADFCSRNQDLIVQVIKEPVGSKGAKVTSHIELAGRYIVFTPYSPRLSISKKLKDPGEIERFKALEGLIREGRGFVVRTAAQGESLDRIRDEYNKLFKVYEKIDRERNFLPSPKLIHRNLSDSRLLIRDNLGNLDQILVNTRKAYEDIVLFLDYYASGKTDMVKYDPDFNIYDQVIIRSELDRALRPKVDLAGGGSITIEELEALTVIDIDSASHIDKYSKDKTIVETNLEAAREIPRQLRLRNIGGIIIIDFIKMGSSRDRTRVLELLRRELEKDRVRTNLLGLTGLGLGELTRRRTKRSLEKELGLQCPKCQGQGQILDLDRIRPK